MLLLTILMVGCQNGPGAATHEARLQVVANPVAPRLVSPTDPPLPEQSLSLASQRPEPRSLRSQQLGRPPSKAIHPSPLRAKRFPPTRPPPRAPVASQPNSSKQEAPKAPASLAKVVSAELPKPGYPLAKPRRVEAEQQEGAEAFGQPVFISLDGEELRAGDEEPAYPTYHPPVVIDGWVEGSSIYVSFDLQPNGNFRASIVDGTGVPEFDAIALTTVRRWKWQPKRVKGRPAASTELIRLKRSLQRER